jgi:hypothetical protein
VTNVLLVILIVGVVPPLADTLEQSYRPAGKPSHSKSTIIVTGTASIVEILLYVAEIYAKCELGSTPLRYEIWRID